MPKVGTTARAARQCVLDMNPYQGGKSIAKVVREQKLDPKAVVKLNSNENPIGVSEHALKAMQKVIPGVNRYPDSNGYNLKLALAKKFNVEVDQITLGNGSNDLLEMIASVYLEPGRFAVFSQYSFPVYSLATHARGAQAQVVPAKDFGHDLDGFLKAIDEKTQVAFVANPNNPTGTFLPEVELKSFLDQVPSDLPVVLDEAYNEYLAPDQQYDATQWIQKYPNLIITRSFSKAYGLAGNRVGYSISTPEMASLLNRVRQPFNVDSLGLAGAEAALGDQAFLKRVYDTNLAGLQQLQRGLDRLGLKYVPSSANFVLVQVGEEQGDAKKVFEALQNKGVMVRPVGEGGLGGHLRVSIGLEHENARFLELLPACIKEALG